MVERALLVVAVSLAVIVGAGMLGRTVRHVFCDAAGALAPVACKAGSR